MIRRILLNERGDAHWVVFILGTILVTTLISCIIIDSWWIDRFDRKTTRVVNDLNLDAYTLLDVEYTAFETGLEIMDDNAVIQKIREGLQTRFKLDSGLAPLAGSPFSGGVQIENIKIVHPNETPYHDGYGRNMEFPGITLTLVGEIKTPMLGITGQHRILITTEVYR